MRATATSPERLSVERPLPVAEGGQDLEGVVADAGQDDPVMGNAEVVEVGVEVLVVAQVLVAIADDEAQAGFGLSRREAHRVRCGGYPEGREDYQTYAPSPSSAFRTCSGSRAITAR